MEAPESRPYVLEMHQADEGDLLRIAGAEGSVIIDSGPAARRAQFEQLLRERPCRLLVITHLDDDHFGGLHALLESGAKVPWPKTIWINDAERRGTVNALLGGMGEQQSSDDGGSIGVLRRLIAEAASWRESAEISFGLQESSERRFDTPVVIEADGDTLRYLRGSMEPRWRGWPYPEEMMRELERRRRESFPELDRRELRRLLEDLWWRWPHYDFIDDETIVRYRPEKGPALRIMASDPELLDALRSDDTALPAPVRGLLHLKRNGPQLLRRHLDSLTLIEALRCLPGVTVENAEAPMCDRPLGSDLALSVVGPDGRDLSYLARDWEHIRRKGEVHRFARQTQLAEATLFSAMTSRFRADTSVTNRSSIQLVAATPSGQAVLTGDGRADTLWRNVRNQRADVPCRVFKAAHHGSAHNIDVRQDRNAVLDHFKPERIWVSGKGKDHPHRDFLDYLERQKPLFPFDLSVTNANEHVSRAGAALGVAVMGDGPLTCPL